MFHASAKSGILLAFLGSTGSKWGMNKDQFPIAQDKQRGKWRVNVAPHLSESGTRERKFFDRKSEAESWVWAQVARLRNDGTLGESLLPPTLRDIAAKAFRLFPDGEEHLLLDAAREYLAARDRRSRSKRFADAYKEWEAWAGAKTRNGVPTSRKYKEQMRLAFDRFASLHDKLCCDITPQDVESTLHGAVRAEHKAARNALLRTLTACLNYGIERDWLTQLPIKAKLMARDSGHREPSILTPDQSARLLTACMAVDPDFLGYYALALFSGIRPTDELAGLRWEHVWGDGGKSISIPAEIAKTRHQRFVTIEPTLAAWFVWINAPRFGLVMPQTNVKKRRRAVQRAAGIDPWPQDVMRHTYASCWMAVHKDEDRCRDNMGHRTKDQLSKHYRKHMTEEDARAFWALLPETVAKITPMKSASA